MSNIEGFADQMRKALDETKEWTEEAVRKAVDKTAKETVQTIKANAPVRTGKYKKGWSAKKTQDNSRGAYGKTVHNRTRYMIAHLLQNGHGGRSAAGAIPHIPSDDETESLFMRNMESELSK